MLLKSADDRVSSRRPLKLLKHQSRLRALLTLGRISNLPTVWSDCLAGWCLAGHGKLASLVGAALTGSLLYEGGMFLNDAFDATFDRQHRPNRPIPSGAISEREVWQWGFALLGLGLINAVWLGWAVVLWATGICACILIYNAIHKRSSIGPLFMGLCRLGLYGVAASTEHRNVNGEVVWKGLALAAYIVGLSFLARKESGGVRLNFWPCLLLATPIVFAGLIDNGPSRMPATVDSLVLAAWTLWALSRSFGQAKPNVGGTVSWLLAGIALVDLLAVASRSEPWIAYFAAFFLLALLLQRFVPAT